MPDNSGARMHDRLAKLLVRDSSTSNWDGELGSCAIALNVQWAWKVKSDKPVREE